MDISVVIPAYNAAPYIEECIASIIAADRSFGSFEIVVVDDASTDDTVARVQAVQERCPLPLRLVTRPCNGGAGQARGAGLAHASGRFIACLDADDIVFPTRFAEQARLLEENPDIVLCGGDLVELDHATRRSPRAITFPTRHTDICADMLFYCPLWAPVTMFRRELLERLPYPTSRIGEDWLFAFEAARLGGIASTGTPAIYYRLHPQQITARSAGDLDAVSWVWAHMLGNIGLQPTEQELRLHALCSPYVRCNPCEVPALKLDSTIDEWQSWSAKLGAAPVDYAPALSDRCARVLQTIRACRYVQREVVRLF